MPPHWPDLIPSEARCALGVVWGRRGLAGVNSRVSNTGTSLALVACDDGGTERQEATAHTVQVPTGGVWPHAVGQKVKTSGHSVDPAIPRAIEPVDASAPAPLDDRTEDGSVRSQIGARRSITRQQDEVFCASQDPVADQVATSAAGQHDVTWAKARPGAHCDTVSVFEERYHAGPLHLEMNRVSGA